MNTYLLTGTAFGTLAISQKLFQNERASLLVQKLRDYDVIALQEVWFPEDQGRKVHIVYEAKKLGFLYHAVTTDKWPQDRTNDGGLLILSRYPIVATGFHVFETKGRSDSAKGVLYAKIKLTDSDYLHLFTTHCEASYSSLDEQGFVDSVTTREAQMRELRTFLDSKSDDFNGDLVMITGDFNIDANIKERNNSAYRKSSPARVMLDDPEKYPLIA